MIFYQTPTRDQVIDYYRSLGANVGFFFSPKDPVKKLEKYKLERDALESLVYIEDEMSNSYHNIIRNYNDTIYELEHEINSQKVL